MGIAVGYILLLLVVSFPVDESSELEFLELTMRRKTKRTPPKMSAILVLNVIGCFPPTIEIPTYLPELKICSTLKNLNQIILVFMNHIQKLEDKFHEHKGKIKGFSHFMLS